jgi:nonsense-mediated mRNA decay protein 3
MRFCPKCGIKIEKGTFCSEHQEIDFQYKDIHVVFCHCKKLFHKNKWVAFDNVTQSIQKVAKDLIKAEVQIISVSEVELKPGIQKTGEIKAIYQDQEFIIPFKYEVTDCPACSKKSGQYYEAILQLRPHDKELKEFVEKQLEKNPDVFVPNKIDLKEGVNYFLTSRKFAIKIGTLLNKSFKGELKVTKKIHTWDRQKSKDVYRITVLFRRENKQEE